MRGHEGISHVVSILPMLTIAKWRRICVLSIGRMMKIDGINICSSAPSKRLIHAPITSVPAGYPSPAQDYSDTKIDLSEMLIRDQVSTFIVRVSAGSMEGAGISDGDELIVDRSIKPRDGHVVIAVIDGEMTVKRLAQLIRR